MFFMLDIYQIKKRLYFFYLYQKSNIYTFNDVYLEKYYKMQTKLIVVLIISSLFISWKSKPDFGIGRYKLLGKVFVNKEELLRNDTIYVLPVYGNNQADFDNRERIYVDNNGKFSKLVTYTTPCLSGGTLRRCAKNGKSDEECLSSLIKGVNYKHLDISRKGKKTRFDFSEAAKNDYFKHLQNKDISQDTFIMVQNFYLK